MTGISFHEALKNPETGELRVVFEIDGADDAYIVVKFFDKIQREKATFKVFRGIYAAVRSHWRTLEVVSDETELAKLVDEALDVINSLLDLLS